MLQHIVSLTSIGKFNFKMLFVSVLVLGFCISTQSSIVNAKTYRWRVQHSWPAGSMYDKQTRLLTERVKELSDGRLIINMFGVGTLAGTLESLDSISKGVYEAHISVPAYWAGKCR